MRNFYLYKVYNSTANRILLVDKDNTIKADIILNVTLDTIERLNHYLVNSYHMEPLTVDEKVFYSLRWNE